jgi:CBS domain-containing protein
MSKTAYDLIARKLESIEKTISVQEAGRIMRDKDVSSLVILDREGRPEGVLTERDIVRKICTSDAEEISTAIVGDIMSSPLITIDSKSTPEQAGELFLKNNIRHLLVVSKENGLEKPLGTITPLDFLWYKEQARRMILENGDDMIDAILEYYRYLH